MIYRIASLAALFLVAANCHAQIRLFYTANRKTFEVTAFENGLPKIGEVLEAGKGEDGSWSWKGDFPPLSRFAWPALAYDLSREPRSMLDRPSLEVAHASIGAGRVKRMLNSEAKEDDLIVIGWVVDGQLVQIRVCSLGSSSSYDRDIGFHLTEREMTGHPLVWLVRQGELVEKAPATFPARAAYPVEPPGNLAADLADFQGELEACLRLAAASGNLAVVRGALGAGAKINKPNQKGQTALALAAANGRAAVIRLLLERGASTNVRDKSDRTALVSAVESRHVDCVQLLAPLAAASGPGKRDRAKALYFALRGTSEAVALALIDAGAELKVDRGKEDSYVLSRLANGEPGLALRVIDTHKIDGSYHRDGFNFLHAAAGYADVELLERLRAIGARPGQRTATGYSPMDVAVGFGNVPAICWFVENGGDQEREAAPINPYVFAISRSQPESVSCLISYGFDVNREAKPGITPLMHAIVSGNRTIAELLANAGGFVDVASRYADVCMAAAIELDSAPLFAALLDQGWDRNRKIFGAILLKDAARFYGAAAIIEAMDADAAGYPESATALADLDAKPMLKSRTTLSYPDQMQAKFGDVDVLVRVFLSADGEPLLFKLGAETPKELGAIVKEGMASWRFSGALKAGSPVPTTIGFKLPFKSELTQEVFETNTLTVQPTPISQVQPNYPYALLAWQVSGWVMLEWIILPTGGITHGRVVESSHPEFEGVALESIYRSSWKPGEINGRKVAVRVRQRMDFTP